MSRDGVYSPLKPINQDRDFGVTVTSRYDLGKHARNFIQEPMVATVDEEDEDMLLYGWSYEPDDDYMYLSHHSWAISKLYHTYDDGSNFTKFWTKLSDYCRPTRCLYYIRHGDEFPNACEMTYGSYDRELFEVFTDGNAGYCLVDRPIGDADFKDVNVVESHEFSLNIKNIF